MISVTKKTPLVNDSPKKGFNIFPKNLNKKFITIVGVSFLIMVLIGLLFYWFQYRPSKIRQDCSWVEMKTEAIPYKPSMTIQELEAKGWIKDCYKDSAQYAEWTRDLNIKLCESLNERTIKDNATPQEAIPAKSWWRKATVKEYDFCLHAKGLQ